MTARTSKRWRHLGLVVTLAAIAWSDTAIGQTIVPDPRPIPPMPRPRPDRPMPVRHTPLEVRRQTVEVQVVDGAAVTSVDQVFFNPYDWAIEGTYIFPLADDVALSKFSMYINGQEVEGKLLGVEEARRTYESIVAKMRDPALLEYLGTRMFQARVFPIQPQSEARVRLAYTQMLESDNGLTAYTYPLATGRHTGKPIGTFSLVAHVKSSVPVKSVFSPSHPIGVTRTSDTQVSASYEGRNVYPDKDFLLHYTLSDKEFGTYRADPSARGRGWLLRVAHRAARVRPWR